MGGFTYRVTNEAGEVVLETDDFRKVAAMQNKAGARQGPAGIGAGGHSYTTRTRQYMSDGAGFEDGANELSGAALAHVARVLGAARAINREEDT